MSMTDAPPTLAAPPATTSWAPPGQGSTPSFEPVEEPQRRGRSGMLLVAVLALFALGVGAFVAIGSSSDNDGITLPAVEPYSLAAAAEQTVAARSVAFDLSVTAGDFGAVTVSGAVDNESQLMTVSTDLSSLIAGSDMPSFGGEVEMLLDGTTGTIYLGADALGGLLPTSASWLSIDLGVLAEQSSQSLDDMRADMFFDPTESARLLLDADAGDIVEIGNEVIDGVDTVHYQVTVDVAAAIAATPQAGSELDASGVDLPETVVYDVWVTADNQLRRASFDLDVAGQQISMVLDMTASDQPLAAEVPADAFDITGFLDF